MTDTVPGIPPPAAPPPEPLPPSAPPNVSVDLYKAVIGQKNQATYLRHFAQFDAKGKTGPTWHWAGFLSALNWLLFRGMWGAALLYAAFMLAAILGLFGLGKLAYDFSNTTAQMLLAGFVLLISLGGLYAHAAYYRFCKKQIVQTVGLSSSIQDARKRLRDQASTNRRLYVLVGLNTALLCALLWGLARIQQAGSMHTRPDTSAESPPLPVVDASAPTLSRHRCRPLHRSQRWRCLQRLRRSLHRLLFRPRRRLPNRLPALRPARLTPGTSFRWAFSPWKTTRSRCRKNWKLRALGCTRWA